MVDAVVERYGRLDILVNNAGIYEERPLTETSYDEWVAYFPRIARVNLCTARPTPSIARRK